MATTQALIFANGDLNDGPAVQDALAQPAIVIAADGGAHLALEMGREIALVVGDMDSVEPATLDSLARQGVGIERHPPEKDTTDLELALLRATLYDVAQIRIIGALGGRLDQTLANIALLNLPELIGRDVRMVSGSQTTWQLSAGDYPLMGEIGDTISLLPVGGPVEGISTQDLGYPLRNETLDFGPARGVSNVISGAAPRVRFDFGHLLVVHTIGRA
jgi:thiamine pyrophosphokinase